MLWGPARSSVGGEGIGGREGVRQCGSGGAASVVGPLLLEKLGRMVGDKAHRRAQAAVDGGVGSI